MPRPGRRGNRDPGDRCFHPVQKQDPAQVTRAKSWYGRGVSTVDSLTPEQLAWLVEDEKRWQRAHRIAQRNPGVDAGGVYRVLRNLEKPPAQRLRAAMIHGRLFSSERRYTDGQWTSRV
jgi:hypothetical protein